MRIMEKFNKLGIARFVVETLFLLIVLIFSMVMLLNGTDDRPVYFTLISGICGKITRLKIKDNKQQSTLANLDDIHGPATRRHHVV